MLQVVAEEPTSWSAYISVLLSLRFSSQPACEQVKANKIVLALCGAFDIESTKLLLQIIIRVLSWCLHARALYINMLFDYQHYAVTKTLSVMVRQSMHTNRMLCRPVH